MSSRSGRAHKTSSNGAKRHPSMCLLLACGGVTLQETTNCATSNSRSMRSIGIVAGTTLVEIVRIDVFSPLHGDPPRQHGVHHRADRYSIYANEIASRLLPCVMGIVHDI